MNKIKHIQINQFQLSRLLNEEEKNGYKLLLADGVYCHTCSGICTEGVEVTEIHLSYMNDILIRGTCEVCNWKVARVMEFGEDLAFYDRANDFRKEQEN